MGTAEPSADIVALWSIHRDATWPTGIGSAEGELMTLDTVISGCVTYFLDEHRLDPQRVIMLTACIGELAALIDSLDDASRPYFLRLQELGRLLLHHDPAG